MGRGSQQKNDRPAHVFLKRATREQFREQRLRQGRMLWWSGRQDWVDSKRTFRGSQISRELAFRETCTGTCRTHTACVTKVFLGPPTDCSLTVRGARASGQKKPRIGERRRRIWAQLHDERPPNACPAPSTRMGWPQRGLREQPRKAAADARFIVYVRLVVPSLGHRASSAAMRGWSRAWCRVL
jgi:hypothetical protein